MPATFLWMLNFIGLKLVILMRMQKAFGALNTEITRVAITVWTRRFMQPCYARLHSYEIAGLREMYRTYRIRLAKIDSSKLKNGWGNTSRMRICPR